MTSVIPIQSKISGTCFVTNLPVKSKEDPVQTVQDAAALLSKFLNLGADATQWTGRGVTRTVTTISTPEEITFRTETVLNRAELADKLRELGKGTEDAVKDLEQGILKVGSQSFTPKDLKTVVGLASLYGNLFGTRNYGTNYDKEVVKTDNTPNETKSEDKLAQHPTANIEELAQVIRGNTTPEALETLRTLASNFSDQELLALVRTIISKNNPPAPPEPPFNKAA